MKVTDTVAGKKVDLLINQNKVNMYICGPTVYSDIHIGNSRPIIFFDIVHRFLSQEGVKVKVVSNITDVDDKIINKAIELNITEKQLVDTTRDEYLRILKDLNVKEYYKMPSVVDYMDKIINFISGLIAKGYAYEVDGQVYFEVEKIDKYGKISKRKLEDMENYNRIEKDMNKKSSHDFLLWKKTEVGIKWDSPWGFGRPGWHTECVSMIDDIFGQTIDIHGGGMDLKFPHHENEEAQAIANGYELARYWMHNGFINIDNEKMSKSIGNVLYVKDILSKYSTNFLRLLILRNTYTQPINITGDLISQVQKQEEKLNRYLSQYEVTGEVVENSYIIELKAFMYDDFNTANYLSGFFKMMDNKEISEIEKTQILTYTVSVMGFVYQKEELSPEVVQLIEKRNVAKKEKNFELADAIRQEIKNLGYLIEDTREGVKWTKQ